MIEKAVEAELTEFISQYKHVTDIRNRKTLVRNGDLPEREILTDLSPVEVRIPKVRDRSGGGIKFNSTLVPQYVRKVKRIEVAEHYRGCIYEAYRPIR